MQKLVKLTDIAMYENDIEMEVRFHTITKFLEAILDLRITDNLRLIEFVKDGGRFSERVDILIEEIYENYPEDLSNEAIFFINDYISQRLKYAFIYSSLDEIEHSSMVLRSGEFDSLTDVVESYSETVSSLFKDIQHSKSVDRFSVNNFSSNDSDSLLDQINRLQEKQLKPNSKIKTAVKMKNKMLNGGFEGGRFYLYLGAPGSGKSVELLNVLLEAKKANEKFVTKDPTKKPAFLYVSQENSVSETLDRIWSHYIGEHKKISDYSLETANQMLKDAGFNDGPELFVKYFPSKSISTVDVDAIIDELDLEGYEVVFLSHDYMKRIRSSNPNSDTYIELGNVADDWANMAKAREIPVVTASQLNRDAFRIIETALKNGKSNIVKQLGTSHIGESVRMIDNSDYVIILGKEEQKYNDKSYMTYKLVKSRARAQDLSYFAHPLKNGMLLEHDTHLEGNKHYSSFNLSTGVEDYDPNDKGNKSIRPVRNRQSKGVKKGNVSDIKELMS